MIRRMLLASVAAGGLVAASNAALAADLPSRAPPIIPVPIFTWAGFYAGVNAGGAFSSGGGGESSIFVPRGTFVAFPAFNGGTVLVTNGGSRSGFTGGVQAGFNWQFGQFVAGIEADFQGISNSGGNRGGGVIVAGNFPDGFAVVGTRDRLNWFGTIRGRLGFAWDRLLVYGTGGFAYGGGDSNNNFGFNGSNDDTRTGWSAGGGLEWAFTNNLTARIEALYTELDQNDRGIVGVTNNGTVVFLGQGNNSNNNGFTVVRAGLNFKF